MGNVYYQVTNQTLSGGDPVFSVTDDVTFTNLTLTENFFDYTSKPINLFDMTGQGIKPSNVPQTSLDTGIVEQRRP